MAAFAQQTTEPVVPTNTPGAKAAIRAGVKAPKLLKSVEPVFPLDAPQQFKRTVMVAFIVDVTGTPQKVHAVNPKGDTFEGAAEEAVQKYRFAPATREGVPVAVKMMVVVSFERSQRR
ncbi:TonB family protein [Granulicella cerasi]|uniref:TonB family protein n=1 Tax=Granulicella cerasi TaxID=741063 RepID=A0ABW1ZAN1_9BACT|nr:TonB family protein [Granulicella cerasi]